MEHGVTRSVVLLKSHVLKFPTLRYGWRKFLRGLIANMVEKEFTTMASEYHLAPTVFGLWGGFMNVQIRCDPLHDEEWEAIRMNHDEVHGREEWHGISCDFKRDNFGVIGGPDGEIVLFDYG